MFYRKKIIFKTKLKYFREMYNLTLEDVAHDLGCAPLILFEIERNNYIPSFRLRTMLCMYFSCRSDEMFEFSFCED